MTLGKSLSLPQPSLSIIPQMGGWHHRLTQLLWGLGTASATFCRPRTMYRAPEMNTYLFNEWIDEWIYSDQNYNVLDQGLANFSCKGPENKFLRLWGPYGLCHHYPTLGCSMKPAPDNKQMGVAVCQWNLICRGRQGTGFGPHASVCRPVFWRPRLLMTTQTNSQNKGSVMTYKPSVRSSHSKGSRRQWEVSPSQLHSSHLLVLSHSPSPWPEPFSYHRYVYRGPSRHPGTLHSVHQPVPPNSSLGPGLWRAPTGMHPFFSYSN